MILLFVSLLFHSLAFADPELIKMFKDSYTSNYVEGRCGDNITGLATRANEKRLNLNQANVLIIENKGGSLMGMVNVEFARNRGRNGSPGYMNWFHHVVLEKDGLIYDYDFGSSPQVVKVNQYFDKMFLSDKKGVGSSIDYVNPEEKLKDYEVEILPAIDMLNARRDRVKSPDGKKMRLREYLQM